MQFSAENWFSNTEKNLWKLKGKKNSARVDLSFRSFTTCSNGVAVLIKKNLPFQRKELESNPNGLVKRKLLNEVITLINIYASNVNNVLLKRTGISDIPV